MDRTISLPTPYILYSWSAKGGDISRVVSEGPTKTTEAVS